MNRETGKYEIKLNEKADSNRTRKYSIEIADQKYTAPPQTLFDFDDYI